MARERTGTLIRKPDGTFKARVTIDLPDGRTDRPWVHFDTTDESKAAKLLARELKRIAGGFVPESGEVIEPGAKTVGDLLDEHSTSLALGDQVLLGAHLASSSLVPVPLRSVKPEQIEALIMNALDQRALKAAQRRKEPSTKKISSETRRKLRGALFRLFEIARKARPPVIKENPVKDAELPVLRGKDREVKKRRAMISDQEFAALIECPEVLPTDVSTYVTEDRVRDYFAPARLELKMMALVARCEGGMRTGDVISWDWTMVDTKGFASCLVPREKTAEPQRLEIPKVLRGPMKAWWVREGSPKEGPVFPVRRGERAGEERVKRGTSFAKRLRRELRRALEWAKLDIRTELFEETRFTLPVDFHSFRRAYNTALAKAGVNTQTAMALAGHSDARTHMRYVLLATEEQSVPDAALPQLKKAKKGLSANRPGIVSFETIRSGADPKTPMFQRDTQESNLRPSAPEADALSN